MQLNRRQGLALVSALSATAFGTAVQAQRQPQEGIHYRKLGKRLPGTPGKVEVVEFFWYGCPHCYAFEDLLNPWIAKLPAQVQFRHVHVFFGERTRAHQQLFLTLSAMGVESKMRAPVFKAIHEQRNPLDSIDAAIALLQPLALDVPKFRATWASFGPKGFGQSRVAAANQLAEAYGLDGVPALGIGGQYLTSPAMATRGEQQPESESGRRVLMIADMLLAQLPKA
jgi:thiol:disulfide interchange protein DsbA